MPFVSNGTARAVSFYSDWRQTDVKRMSAERMYSVRTREPLPWLKTKNCNRVASNKVLHYVLHDGGVSSPALARVFSQILDRYVER